MLGRLLILVILLGGGLFGLDALLARDGVPPPATGATQVVAVLPVAHALARALRDQRTPPPTASDSG